MPAYPSVFDLALLRGSRAKQCSDPSDAFQQLLGECLQEIAGSSVHVSATKGRDGGIDIYADHGLLDLKGPTIVEAKVHEESNRLWENVVAGWGAVKKALNGAAEKNWPRPHDPWRRCRSYAYCIAARLNQSQIEDLESRILQWLSSLPPENRPPVEQVKVFDWSMLRPYLNSAARTRDLWLGFGSPVLVAHEDYRTELSGFRRFLLSTHLPYRPLRNVQHRPQAILDRLGGFNGERGLLVVGPGGVGKTRLAMEVAEIAHEKGARVLHALPGEPHLTSEALMEAVLEDRGGPSTVLVLFDYLDQMDGLDLGMLQRHLLPRAKERQLNLLLLANARPGEEKPERAETAMRLGLFEALTLEVDRQEGEQLSSYVVGTVAPTALAELGIDRLSALCGSRPIIAMLAAREVERRVRAGGEEAEVLKGLSSPDLLRWLRFRLQWSGLTVPEVRGFSLPDVETPIVAAAAVLAAAPQVESALRQVAAKVLHDPVRADFVVNQLLTLGWLEADDRAYSTPHDIVADEVLDQVLRLRPRRVLRRNALSAVLSAATELPRSLGRFSIALRRLASRGEEAPGGLEEASADWLTESAATIGGALSQADSDESAYALGAIFAWPPWLDASLESWRILVEPWLRLHGAGIEARHILHRGLKLLRTDQADELKRIALEWRSKHEKALEAGFVLHPLLERQDLTTGESLQAREWALEWRGEHGSKPEAQFVLKPLLERRDLTTDESSQAREWALAWRGEHEKTPEAGFVLPPLLERQDLTTDESSQAREWALAWRGEHGSKPEAQFVLKPLLERWDLTTGESSQAREWALAWRGAHEKTRDAGFVLPPLLKRLDLTTEEALEALEWALAWLKGRERLLESGYVLSALLARADLGRKQKEQSVEASLDWLGAQGDTESATFVIRALLTRSDHSRPHQMRLWELAVEWSYGHRSRDDLDFILKKLLRDRWIPDVLWERTARIAVDWLCAIPQAPERDHVLYGLVLRPNLLSARDRNWLIKDALGWLEVFDSEARAFALRSRLWSLLPPDRFEAWELDQVEAIFDRFPNAIGAPLARLLPLTARSGLTDVHSRVFQLTKAWLSRTDLKPAARHHFLTACLDAIDRGNWPRRELGEKALAALGLIESSA